MNSVTFICSSLLSIYFVLFTPMNSQAQDLLPMPDRIFIDYEAGVTFRYPYSVYFPDPFASVLYGHVVDPHTGKKEQLHIRYISHPVEEIQSLLQQELIEHNEARDLFSLAEIDEKEKVDVELLEVISSDEGLKLSGLDFNLRDVVRVLYPRHERFVEAHVYYEENNRNSHRGVSYAPAHIQSCMSTYGGITIYLVRYLDRFIGLELSGVRGSNSISKEIIQSFECMQFHEGINRFISFAEQKTDKLFVLNSSGDYLQKTKVDLPLKWNDAFEIESQHFHITATCTVSDAIKLLDYLEHMHKGMRIWFPDERSLRMKYEIHITNTKKEFEVLGNNLYGDIKEVFKTNRRSSLGGFFNWRTVAVYTFTQDIKNSQLSDKMRVAHEFVHQYIFIHSDYNFSLPVWLNEGIAVFFENGFEDDAYMQVAVPFLRLKLLKTFYKQDKKLVGQMDAYLRGAGIGNVHQYAEAYAIIHQLMSEEGGYERFLQLWKGLCAGKNGIRLFREIFTAERLRLETYEDDLLRWGQDVIAYVQSGKSEKAFHYPNQQIAK